MIKFNGASYETIPAEFQSSTVHADNSLNLIRYYFRVNNLPASGSQLYYLYVGPAALTPEPIPFPLTDTDFLAGLGAL